MNELQKISHELKTQDNRCTNHPMFTVQQRVAIYGMDSDYVEDFDWVDEDGHEVSVEYMDEHPHEYFEKLYYRCIWEDVQTFLTEKSAQDYINEYKHNLNQPRVYVKSGHANKEYQTIRNFLLELK